MIFGYQYGYKAGFKLNPAAVVRILFFCGKSAKDRSFRVEEIQAGGPAGEKPPVDPGSIVVYPEGGIIIGEGSKLSPQPKLESKNLVLAKYNERGAIAIESEAGKDGVLNIIPFAGVWHLGFFNEVNVTIKNTGANSVSVSTRIESKGKKFSDRISLESINPDEEKLVTVPFIPAKSWIGEWDPDKKRGGVVKGSGTEFESNKTCGIEITIGKNNASSKLKISSVVASARSIIIPDWVGKRPPVEGNWKLTFEDNFDGESIDLKKWNIYTPNFWDKQTHFTKENVIVKDGFLILRYEKKTGFHNDNPEDKSPVAKTDFACGFADSYGKWTQRYGYFEARVKVPTCPGLWPAFWTMPDRGGDPDPKVNPQWKRASTHNGGMEFDIMEHLTGWGPYRFNCAFHWDGYEKEHKAIGTSNIYVKADKDGFFTVGMLWLPGFVAYYANGVEFARWENERICNVQSYPIFYMVSGGWANLPLDQSQLPADFVIDYIRVWQRDDLASPEDGFKPNEGNPRSQF